MARNWPPEINFYGTAAMSAAKDSDVIVDAPAG
jgi:hypothetical protein